MSGSTLCLFSLQRGCKFDGEKSRRKREGSFYSEFTLRSCVHATFISSFPSDDACACVVVVQLRYHLKTLNFLCYCSLMSCLEAINTYQFIYKYSVSRLLLKINEMTLNFLTLRYVLSRLFTYF